jgi:hypothetical protein
VRRTDGVTLLDRLQNDDRVKNTETSLMQDKNRRYGRSLK